MTKPLLLSLALLTLTACAKEVAVKETPAKDALKCQTKPIQPINIIDKPIDFGKERIAMTKEYIKSHYGKSVKNIEITPKIIVLHWTAEMSFDKSFARLKPQKLFTDRKDIAKASLLNVSSQFLVARDGTIYRLMPENWMARHVIGLNYSSIGVENVGGKGNKVDDLTLAQRASNIALIKYLKAKHPSIEYLIGHHEYRQMESTSLWLEKDKGYRTVKSDPGAKFMGEMRKATKTLHLKMPPKVK
ncbi:MAG: peptidoglycan recognition family protein [Campylobacterota bacterium]|nr:peptidoglycan recognition family protein [Campylobacterota bacterium]